MNLLSHARLLALLLLLAPFAPLTAEEPAPAETAEPNAEATAEPADAEAPVATVLHKLLTFRGVMQPAKENPDLADKAFRLTVRITEQAEATEEAAPPAVEPAPAEGAEEPASEAEEPVTEPSEAPYSAGSDAAALPGFTFHWFLEEDKAGGWAWPDHFGVYHAAHAALSAEDFRAAPALLYQHGESATAVRLPLPLYFAPGHELVDGASWSQGGLIVSVEQAERGQPVWQIGSRGALGMKRTLWVDRASPLVLAANETVFIAQGTEFHVKYELAESLPLTAEQEEQFLAQFGKLVEFRESLELPPRTPQREWSQDQLAAIEQKLPTLEELRGGPIAAFAKRLETEWKEETGRSDALALLKEAAQGSKPKAFELSGLSGAELSSKSLAGEVTVLHFWEYRDAPLVEPYGQVGYLDFLYRQHARAGLRVYGVHVDEGLADAEKRNASIAGAGKLQKFMNLGYPVLLDDGTVLKQFGDPREAGGKLPLFVVIDSAGEIMHYSAGLYKVDRDRGLEKLNFIVSRALEDRGAAPKP